jgi:hypothetical protein
MVSSLRQPQRIVRCVLAVPFLMVLLGPGRKVRPLGHALLTAGVFVVLRLPNGHSCAEERSQAGEKVSPWRIEGRPCQIAARRRQDLQTSGHSKST